MKLDVWYQTFPMFDGARLEASINSGASWFVIGGNNEPTNWYNAMMTDTVWTGSSNAWLTAQHPLNFLGGQSNVRLKIIYKTGMMSIQTDEGFAFDNILIYECNDMPTADFTLVQNGATVMVTNASTDATAYLWDFDDQLAMLPDTNTNTSYTYTMNGTYIVTLAAFNDCGVSYSSQSINVSVVGIDEAVENSLSIFPNPAHEFINLNIDNNTENIYKIQIHNVLGQEIYVDYNPDINKVINLKDLNKGVYYLTVSTSERLLTNKFIVN